jgi:hypothetical protein
MVLASDYGPVVAAERRGGEAGAVEERGERVGLPGVAHGDGLGHGGEETITVSPSSLASAQCQTWSAPATENSPSLSPFTTRPPSVWVEMKAQRARVDFSAAKGARSKRRPGRNVFQREQGQAFADGQLFRRVDVVGVAGVDGDGEAGVRHGARGQGLGLAQFRPAVGAGLVAALHKRGQADDVERQIGPAGTARASRRSARATACDIAGRVWKLASPWYQSAPVRRAGRAGAACPDKAPSAWSASFHSRAAAGAAAGIDAESAARQPPSSGTEVPSPRTASGPSAGERKPPSGRS